MVSFPSNFTEPARGRTMPMIDFMVVLFPAPFRPTTVTSSPWRTSRSTPCSTCDSPYQAFRPFTLSSASGMFGPEVSRDHGGILRDALVVAFGKHFAARQHRDAVRQARDYAKVVLDHQHRSILRDVLDQLRDALDVLVAHPRGRLVEEHQLGIERQRGRDLQRALSAVGELRGDGLD